MKNSRSFEEILAADGELYYTNQGYSMYPLIHPQEDLLHIVKASSYHKGDIVLYLSKEHKYILHRILAFNNNGTVLLAGDHNTYKDEPIEKGQLLGILKDITKKNGRILRFPKDKKLWRFVCVHLFPLKVLILKFSFLWRRHEKQKQ